MVSLRKTEKAFLEDRSDNSESQGPNNVSYKISAK